MTAAPRRILPTVLKVTAVLSAIAIATFLIVRAQRGRPAAPDPSPDFVLPEGVPLLINPLTDPARNLELPAILNTSKSLVIEPSDDAADKPSPTNGFDDFGLFSSKSARLPSQPLPQPQPEPQQPKKQ
ncbi:MAG: hypothetical protein MUC36_17915 [Planctomycetes bacterium]|jgi:hypothetical protein|nr:hypothetical protein [Planctomycetota bacterium]